MGTRPQNPRQFRYPPPKPRQTRPAARGGGRRVRAAVCVACALREHSASLCALCADAAHTAQARMVSVGAPARSVPDVRGVSVRRHRLFAAPDSDRMARFDRSLYSRM